MAENLEIRPAELDDFVALASLADELGYPQDASLVRLRLIDILERDDHAAWVACSGHRVVGWIHAFVARRIESESFAEIGGLVVTEVLRHRGIGARLLAVAEQWAISGGFPKLRVRSRSTRHDAHHFFERLGFKTLKEQRVFDKHLFLSRP